MEARKCPNCGGLLDSSRCRFCDARVVDDPIQATAPNAAKDVYIDPAIRAYIRALLAAAHAPADVEEELVARARAAAHAANRGFTTPENVKATAPETLRRYVASDDAVRLIMDNVAVP
jgi:MoxR-like ATPase